MKNWCLQILSKSLSNSHKILKTRHQMTKINQIFNFFMIFIFPTRTPKVLFIRPTDQNFLLLSKKLRTPCYKVSLKRYLVDVKKSNNYIDQTYRIDQIIIVLFVLFCFCHKEYYIFFTNQVPKQRLANLAACDDFEV